MACATTLWQQVKWQPACARPAYIHIDIHALHVILAHTLYLWLECHRRHRMGRRSICQFHLCTWHRDMHMYTSDVCASRICVHTVMRRGVHHCVSTRVRRPPAHSALCAHTHSSCVVHMPHRPGTYDSPYTVRIIIRYVHYSCSNATYRGPARTFRSRFGHRPTVPSKSIITFIWDV